MQLINTNEDNIIQKKEVEEFKNTQQAPSIFSEYFDAVISDTDYNKFLNDITEIYHNANESPNLDFKDKNVQKKFEDDSIAQTKSDLYQQFDLKFNSENEFNKVFDYLISQGMNDAAIEQKIRTMQPLTKMEKIMQDSMILQFKEECNSAMWKFQNKDSFDKAFETVVMQALSGEFDIIEIPKQFKALNIEKVPTMEDLKADPTLYDLHMNNDSPMLDMDWSNSREILNYLCYEEHSFDNTSQEHLPEGYDPNIVFQNGLTTGLGIDYVHTQMNNGKGYTGEGVKVAIIDSFIKGHDDIQFAEQHESPYAPEWTEPHYHGIATAGIIGSKKTGIAPNSSIYYYGENEGKDKKYRDASMIDDLQQILEHNNQNPNNKIRIVSISSPIYGDEEAQAIIKQLEEQGVWVLSSGENGKDCDAKKFGYLEKIDPMSDPNDFDNYQIYNENDSENYGNLYINSGNLTVPSDLSSSGYRHDPRPSQSWVIPVITGYYTLACQADPSMTKERFMELAERTAQVKESTMPIKDESYQNAPPLGRTKETKEIKIIDIQALLQAIEEEKALNN